MIELDQNYNADLLDAMADIAYEQEQAMREAFETHQEQWIMRECNQYDWQLVEHPLTYQGD